MSGTQSAGVSLARSPTLCDGLGSTLPAGSPPAPSREAPAVVGGQWMPYAMFYKGWLLPAERAAVKDYIVVCTNPAGEEQPKEKENRGEKELPVLGIGATVLSSKESSLTPLGVSYTSAFSSSLGNVSGTPASVVAAAAAAVRPSTPANSRESSQEQIFPVALAAAHAAAAAHVAPKRSFYMVRKQHVSCKRNFVAQVWKCIDLCTNDKCPAGCRKVHVTDKANLVEISTSDVKKIMLNVGNGVVSEVDIESLEITAGLLFCCTLFRLGLIHAISLKICQFNTNCKSKSRCLCIHQRPAAAKEARAALLLPPEFTFSTSIHDVSRLLSQNNFPDVLVKLGIETVGDLQILSNAAFEHAAQNGLPQHALQWTQLQNFREIDEAKPLMMVAQQFPGITDAILSAIPASLGTVECLLQLRPRQLYTFSLAPRLVDTLEKIRGRIENDGPAYSTISLSSMEMDAFFVRISTLVLTFRETNAHKSWRKQDATRPIVTSLITYVDHTTCKCIHEGADLPKSPGKGTLLSPYLGTGRSRSKLNPAVNFPYDNSWCRCCRRYELAVNYELSTPSGSRCSEQNCLGKLASMGVPTHAIREIFVHGDTHNGDDPNPLFPCGVCENMFRRINGDVQKKYAGDVQLYMFDAVSNPRKLVCLPVQEISHRDGASFKRFVSEDLRVRMGSEEPGMTVNLAT